METREAITQEASNQEVWKPVVGYAGYYEVSSRGRVRSLDRAVETIRGQRKVKGKILNAGESGEGYRAVTLCRSGKEVNRLVHRLVAEAFIGPIPEGNHVDHIDNDPANNRIDNLQAITPRENVARQKLFGTSKADRVANGTDHETRKTHCKNGHEFYGEILEQSHLKRGWRQCIVCHRANNFIRYHKIHKDMHWAVYDYQLERFLLEESEKV